MTEAEREEPARQSKSQRHSRWERTRAHILLLSERAREGRVAKDAAIVIQIKVASLTVSRVLQRFAERGPHKSLRLFRSALIE